MASVILSHLAGFSSIRGLLPEWTPNLGGLGVQVFFGISGFVICRGLLREHEQFGRISLLGFYIRRFFRIVPPLAIYVATVFMLGALGVVNTDSSILRALTFTCNVPGATCGYFLGSHTWSLSVEEQFYLLAPLMLATLAGRAKSVLVVACLALPPTASLLLYATDHELAGFVWNFCAIGWGVACGLLENRLQRVVAVLPGWTTFAAVALLVTIWQWQATAVVTAVKTVALWPLIMFVLMMVSFRRTVADRLLLSRPVQSLGAVSYGIYLWQQLATAEYPGAGPWFYVVSVAGCIALAFASYRWMEQPLISYGKKVSAAVRSVRPGARSGSGTQREPISRV